MKLKQRPYRTESDYWMIREFLRDVYLQNDRREFSWSVAPLDYWRWHGIANLDEGPLEECVLLWETRDNQIAAVLNGLGRGRARFQIDPRFRTRDLEVEMISMAEDRFSAISLRSRRRMLSVVLRDGDTLREEILVQRGYQPKAGSQLFDRYRDLTCPISESSSPKGYIIRPMALEDIPSRSWASWRAFHPSEPDEDYQGESWYVNLMKAPLYRRDLDLVATDDTGAIAAFATVWYDDVTRSGYFEPVGTVPEHKRKGLCTALLQEGMRRLAERGGTRATIGGGGESNPAAERVYSKVFGDNRDSYVTWVRYMEGQPT